LMENNPDMAESIRKLAAERAGQFNPNKPE